MAAAPTVVWKSAAICGSSELVTRTCAWLAKPATASSMIERTGVLRDPSEAGCEEDDTVGFALEPDAGGGGRPALTVDAARAF